MDQKKTLWIIAAVGAFLLAVLGPALFMYASSSHTPAAVTASVPANNNSQYDNNGWVANVQAPVTQPVPTPYVAQADKASELIVLSENTKVYGVPNETTYDSTTIDLNTLRTEMQVNKEIPSVSVPVAQPQNINITVNVPEKTPSYEEKTVTNEYYVTQIENTNTVVVPETKRPEPKKMAVQPVKENKPVAKTATTATTTTTSVKTTTKTTTNVEPKKITQYWVQVAAYSNKKGAENARSILDNNKIPADVFTFQDNKNNLFYRVRVGPYTTKSEAEYWKSRIIQINEFSKAESFVTSTTN